MKSSPEFFTNGAAVRIAAALAGTGVMLGAFGSHVLKATLAAQPNGLENWGTAVLYHLIHALAMLVVAGREGAVNRMAWRLFLAGVIAFSGSLYLLAAFQWRFLWPVTPLGGVLLISGWAVLAFFDGTRRRKA